MNRKTLKALKGSIEKWREIAFADGDDLGHLNCPLCHIFFERPGCEGCPVSEKVNDECCEGTPYVNWCEHQIAHNHAVPQKVFDEESEQIAIKEYKFLKSLLPKGESA